MEIEFQSFFFSLLFQLALQGFLIYTDTHG